MKILFICTDPGVPVFGRKGCSTHVRETCLTLLDLGNEVRLLCSNDEGDDGGRERLPLNHVAPFQSKKLGFDLRHLLLDRRVRRAAESLIAEWKPDAIYERYSLYSRTGTALAREHRLPHILEINALMTKEQSDRIRLMPLARRAENRIFRDARHVVVVSNPLRDEVAEVRGSAEKISLMPMAVNLDAFHPSIDGSAVRKAHGLEGRFVIGYVGTLTGWHGISLLYDLARALKDGGISDAAILVVGGDERRLAEHRAKVAKRGLENELFFIGPVPHASVPAHIRAMDAAIVPDTTYWSSPAKLFEYQGCGVPVLAPRYPAIEIAMRHLEEGWIFTPRDVGEMVEGVKYLHRDPERRREMGMRGRAHAERDHSWEKLGQDVIEIFEKQREELNGRK